MKHLLVLLLFLPFLLPAQNCADCRYMSPVFNNVQVSTEPFGEGVNADGNLQELFLDVYEPVGDTAALRPAVVFAFGGGFIQGDRKENYVVGACTRFAQAGYVGVANDYRIGFDVIGVITDPFGELMKTFFRAMQDMRATVQYLRYQADSLGNPYRIDTNMIVIGGASAGAITALMVSQCDKDTEFSEVASLNNINSLGGFYSTSGYHPSYSWDHQAVINIAGGMLKSDWIEDNGIPIISAHGDQDQVVPFKGGTLNFGFVNIGLEGSYNVQQKADSAGLCNFLFTMVGEDHPSGGAGVAYYDAIFDRFLPRMHAVLNGRSFCCALDAKLSPNDMQMVAQGDPQTVQATVSQAGGNENLLWCSWPCALTSTASSITVTPSLPQNYMFVVWEDSCQATDFVRFDEITVGLETEFSEGWVIFPVPFSDQIRLRRESGAGGALSVEVRDLNGRLLKSEFLNLGAGETHQMELGGLSAGSYFLRIKTEDEVRNFRIVRQ